MPPEEYNILLKRVAAQEVNSCENKKSEVPFFYISKQKHMYKVRRTYYFFYKLHDLAYKNEF